MYKLSNLVLDQYDDPGLTLVKSVLGEDGLKKVASYIPKLSSIEGKRDINDFAIGFMDEKGNISGRFPIFDENTTTLSAFYFENNYKKLPKEYIKTAALRIGWALKKYAPEAYEYSEFIKETFDKYAALTPKEAPIVDLTDEKIESFEKTAAVLTSQEKNNLPDSAFGLVIKKKDGTKIRKYPLIDEAHVRNAIVRFAQFSQNIPATYRATLARKIKAKAKQYNIQISEDNPLNKYASALGTISPHFEKNIQDRKNFVTPEEWQAYDKLIKDVMIDKTLYMPEDVVVKVASLDKKFGVNSFYGENLMDPETVVYGNNDIRYSPVERSYLENKEKIMQKKASLNELFGDGFVDNLTMDKFVNMEPETRAMILKIANRK